MPSRRTRFPFQLISCLRSHPPPRPRRWSPRNITYRRDPVGWSPPMIIHRRDPVGDRRGISLTAAAQLLPTELKCKTLGRIHMQALDAGITPCIVSLPVYTAHARTSASLRPSRPLPVSRLFHAGCTSS